MTNDELPKPRLMAAAWSFRDSSFISYPPSFIIAIAAGCQDVRASTTMTANEA
jgi:hypothetical protein